MHVNIFVGVFSELLYNPQRSSRSQNAWEEIHHRFTLDVLSIQLHVYLHYLPKGYLIDWFIHSM